MCSGMDKTWKRHTSDADELAPVALRLAAARLRGRCLETLGGRGACQDSLPPRHCWGRRWPGRLWSRPPPRPRLALLHRETSQVKCCSWNIEIELRTQTFRLFNLLVFVLDVELALLLLVVHVLVQLLEVGRERTPVLLHMRKGTWCYKCDYSQVNAVRRTYDLRLRPDRHDATRDRHDDGSHRMPLRNNCIYECMSSYARQGLLKDYSPQRRAAPLLSCRARSSPCVQWRAPTRRASVGEPNLRRCTRRRQKSSTSSTLTWTKQNTIDITQTDIYDKLTPNSSLVDEVLQLLDGFGFSVQAAREDLASLVHADHAVSRVDEQSAAINN